MIANQNENLSILLRNDAVLYAIFQQFGAPVIQVREPGFASLCHIILEQQVSIASAKACYQKLEMNFGTLTPFNIYNGTEEAFKNCGVSRQKITYLKDLAFRILENTLDLESLSSQSESTIRATLLQVKGIGNWSIDVYLMFCLQHEDLIPLGDIAIKNTIKALYNIEAPISQQELTENWKPYRSLASFLLWHYYIEKRKAGTQLQK